MKHLGAIGAALGLATLSSAGAAQPFAEIVADSIGYVNVAPNVVLIEDNDSSRMCQVMVSDAYFDAVAAEDETGLAAATPSIRCVPTFLFAASAQVQSPQPFNTLIDDSVGYVDVAPGQILVEGDETSHLCRIQVTPAYFDAYATGDGDGLRAAAPSITCVDIETLTK